LVDCKTLKPGRNLSFVNRLSGIFHRRDSLPIERRRARAAREREAQPA
jgi:hypothetical protein